MNKETFDKVAELAKNIKILELINEIIKKGSLNFIDESYKGIIILPYQKKLICDILLKHETEIRDEIDNRLNILKKQVEDL